MNITNNLVMSLLEKIRAPSHYSIDLCSIVQHGPNGVVVMYTAFDPTGARTDYRCAGFRIDQARLVLIQTFDMIVEGGVA